MAVQSIATGGIPLGLFQKLMAEKTTAPKPQQVSLLDQSHYGHELDVTGRQAYCADCEVYL